MVTWIIEYEMVSVKHLNNISKTIHKTLVVVGSIRLTNYHLVVLNNSLLQQVPFKKMHLGTVQSGKSVRVLMPEYTMGFVIRNVYNGQEFGMYCLRSYGYIVTHQLINIGDNTTVSTDNAYLTLKNNSTQYTADYYYYYIET